MELRPQAGGMFMQGTRHGVAMSMTVSNGMKRILAQACSVVFAVCALGGEVRPMGFRSTLHHTNIVRTDGEKPIRRMRAAPLPSSWDSREHGWVTPIRDQSPFGTCWAFAANAVIETQLLKMGRGTWDLSEKNMVELNGFELDKDDGGNYEIAAAYLLRWGGSVAESNDVYRSRTDWDANPSLPLAPAIHIQNIVWVPALDGTEESRNELKSAIMEYGAVAVSCHWNFGIENGSAYCYNGSADCNHAVVVVGWDDSYSTNNFRASCCPSGNGAWIIKNSWGVTSGDYGFWYISYYDTKFGSGNGVVFIPATAEESYTAVYGYDKHGLTYDIAAAYPSRRHYNLQAAVFTSGWNEELAAVGIYAVTMTTPYEISIYTNVTRNASTPISGGVLACRTTGTLTHAGFSTISLPVSLVLADGSNFSVVYRQTGNFKSVLVDCTCIDVCYPNHKPGESYFGYAGENGEADMWFDGADSDVVNQVDHTDVAWGACIKAYTRTTASAREGDAPGETENGTAALADFAASNSAAYAQYAETFGAFANIVGANGRTLWASWLAGFDPARPSDNSLSVSIAVKNSIPSLSWTPNLGDARTYTIWGRSDLSQTNDWEALTENAIGTGPYHFFKVSVGQP